MYQIIGSLKTDASLVIMQVIHGIIIQLEVATCSSLLVAGSQADLLGSEQCTSLSGTTIIVYLCATSRAVLIGHYFIHVI